MPSASEILSGLTRIASEALFVAVLWHVAIAAFFVALARGWRPWARTAGLLATLPVISVSGLALAFGNSFNGATFALLAVGLAVSAARAPRERIALRTGWPAWLGTFLVTFAFVYPHFLEGVSPLVYLVAAPVGLVPCPTLSLLIGVALLGVAPHVRAWPVLLIVAGGVYALVGAIRLGVLIDLVLLLGVVGLAPARIDEPTNDTFAPIR